MAPQPPALTFTPNPEPPPEPQTPLYQEGCIYILEQQMMLQVLKLCHGISLWPLQDLELNCKEFLVAGFQHLSQEL